MAAKKSLKNKKRQPKKMRSSRKTRKSSKKGHLTKDCKHYVFPNGEATVCTSTFHYP